MDNSTVLFAGKGSTLIKVNVLASARLDSSHTPQPELANPAIPLALHATISTVQTVFHAPILLFSFKAVLALLIAHQGYCTMVCA